MIRECKHHGKVTFWKSGKSWKCSKCGSARATNYRRKRKLELIERLGGQCARCGYDRHPAALCFHHKDSSKKNPKMINRRDTNPITYYSKDVIEAEIDNLELICHNCHMEEHWDT